MNCRRCTYLGAYYKFKVFNYEQEVSKCNPV